MSQKPDFGSESALLDSDFNVDAGADTPMADGEIERLIAEFEAASQFDENGVEYWTARSLQSLLGYSNFRNFLKTVERAKIACGSVGQPIRDHFVDVIKMIELGKGATREVEDIRLSRYACYLITQNGDARKKPIAFGQTYFAIQTRRQELADQARSAPLTEDEKRIFLRNQIKAHNIKLSSAAKDAGVVTPQEFAIFHSKGYQGLYGRTVPEIRSYKGLQSNADILDRMGSSELAANFFRVTQTEEKLRKEKIKGLHNAYETHYAVGRQVREAMLKISGIAPEDLPVADSIKNVEKRIKGAQGQTCLPAVPVLVQDAPRDFSEDISEACPEKDDRRPIDLRSDLWKFALLIMALRTDGMVSTTELIAEFPKYIHIPEGTLDAPSSRKDSKFSQLVRNLKSHKTSKTNLIYQGYAEDVKGGFRITEKGRAFVNEYFSE